MKKFIIITALHASLFTLNVTQAQIIHVPAGQPTIQAGIDASGNGDTVLVADGTYLENINFMGKAITVASHFLMDGDTNHINNTVIDGSQPGNPDYGSVVTLMTGEDSSSVICGFTITGGIGMYDPVYSARIGGGIVCYYATAKIIHNKITGNSITSATDAWGGGIFSYNETGDAWIVIESNIITNNQCTVGTGIAEGGGMEVIGDARICNNTVTNNLCNGPSGGADGGGIYHASLNTIPDTLILMHNNISNNELTTGNTARGGGVLIYASHCDVLNNTIENNSLTGNMTNGGGILVRESVYANVRANTIRFNTVDPVNTFWGAGLMFVMPDGPTYVGNNEFLNNEGPLVVANTGVGGGLAIMDAELHTTEVTGNIFRNNTGNFGGGFYSRDCYTLRAVNNLFDGNEANSGGAVGMWIPVSAEDPRPAYINNTFVNNTALTQGGAAHLNCETNLPIFFNDIFYGNSAPTANDINYYGSTDPIVVSYSDINTANITGPWTGVANFNADPGFIAGDTLYHLGLTSPCKNAGIDVLDVDGTVYSAPLEDMDGEVRPDPQYHFFDAGADERWEIPPAPVALEPEMIGEDYFIARWHSVALAMGYRLDVAYDGSFSQMVTGYNNLDVGNNTSAFVSGLESMTYYYRVRAYNTLFTSQNSNVITVVGVGTEEFKIQNSTLKIQHYPNPTNGNFNFQFSIFNFQSVSLRIFDVHGREVATVLDEMLPAGEHVVRFDASWLPDGVYFVELRAKGDGHRAKGIEHRAVGKVVVTR